MAAELTPGAIARLVAGETGALVTVQVLGIKKVTTAQAQQDRYRVLLSDGEHSQSCMLATQLADRVHAGLLKEGSIITLLDYISNQVQNKKVVIVLNLDVVQAEAPRIGNPVMYDKAQGGAAAPPAGPGAPPPQQQQYGAPPPMGGPAPGGMTGSNNVPIPNMRQFPAYPQGQ